MKLNQILEMSQIVDFNYGYANSKIQKILDSYDINDFKLVDKKLNLYQSTNSSYSEIWFIVFNKPKTKIDFIVKFKQDAIRVDKNNIPVIVPFFTYKINERLDRVVSKVYKIAAEQLNKPILSDKQQTEDMANIWINFYENKKKYHIKFAEFIDTQTNSIMNMEDLSNTPHGVHNKFEQGQRYRVMIDYNNNLDKLKENLNENNSIYFKGVLDERN